MEIRRLMFGLSSHFLLKGCYKDSIVVCKTQPRVGIFKKSQLGPAWMLARLPLKNFMHKAIIYPSDCLK